MRAIIFVDVQNDFLKGGKLAYAYPSEDNTGSIVDFAKACVADAECRVYATRDTHEATCNKPGCEPSGYLATLEGKNLPVEHCVEGTDGWQIATPLMDVLLGSCTFVNKPTFGSYDLVEVVHDDFGDAGPDEIVLAGYDLSICVLSNALMLRAKYPNTKITVYRNLCGDISKESYGAAIQVLKNCQVGIALWAA